MAAGGSVDVEHTASWERRTPTQLVTRREAAVKAQVVDAVGPFPPPQDCCRPRWWWRRWVGYASAQA